MDTVRARGAASNRAAQSVIRLETGDQLFGALIALSDLLEGAPHTDRVIASRMLRRLRALLVVLADAMLSDAAVVSPQIGRSIAGIADDAARLPEDAPLRRLIDTIVDRLQIAYTLAVPANFSPGASKSRS